MIGAVDKGTMTHPDPLDVRQEGACDEFTMPTSKTDRTEVAQDEGHPEFSGRWVECLLAKEGSIVRG